MPKFEREVEIDAPVEKVWEVITDPGHWPEWFPGIESTPNVTSISEGQTLEWMLKDHTGRATIAKMEPMERLEVRTLVEDDEDQHVFTLRPSGGFLGLAADECKVKYTLDTLMGGGMIARFVAGGNPKDALQVKKALHRLRRTVESL